jgi:membrane-bound metal-dependent hydrolase YbcI (DUF457 family)
LCHLPLPSRHAELSWIPPLVALVFGLDLLWALVDGSTGTLAFGLIDEPAHLATCAIALLALSALSRRRLPAAFVVAALVASVAIDIDHAPGYLGWDGLIGAGPRPYTHSLFLVLAVLVSAFLIPRRYKAGVLGIAFGISAHLLRDLATGPGISLAAPFSNGAARVPYFVYALPLVALAATALFIAIRRPRARLGWQLGGAAVLLLAVAVATSVGVDSAAAKERHHAKHRHSKRHHPEQRVAMGIYLPGADQDPGVIDAFAQAVGREPAIVHLYRSWTQLPFEPAPLSAVWERGSMPLVTWEPWSDFEGMGVPLWEIAGGYKDGYIAEAARQAAAWGGPLLVRFAQEMNGGWYPWGKVAGNSPALYKAAWRRIVSIFRQEGATNVRWVWTPYVNFGKLPFQRYYPGDKWVDWAGFDGFNWGEPFESFRRIFDDSYAELVKMTAKPLMIAETGSVEGSPGSKAIWVRRAFSRGLPRYPHVRALDWFSDVHPRGMNWRVDTSPSAFSALAIEMRKPRYDPPWGFLLAKPPWLKKR